MENWESEVERNWENTPAPDPGPEADQPDPGGGKARKEASDGRDLYLNIRVLVIMMTAFVLMFTFVARIIVVSGPSMLDTLRQPVNATEGQTVDINYDTDTVYVDGTPLKEDYTKERMQIPTYGEGLNHVTVPEGCIFVMGDNRNHSADSRFPGIGIVDTRCVIGKGIAVMFPFHRWKGL